MSDHQDRVVLETQPGGDVLVRPRAGLPETSRARRLERAARAGALSLPEVAPEASREESTANRDARWHLKDVAVKPSGVGGYHVELRFAVQAGTATGLRHAIGQQVREAAHDRGLGPYLEMVTIVVDGMRP